MHVAQNCAKTCVHETLTVKLALGCDSADKNTCPSLRLHSCLCVAWSFSSYFFFTFSCYTHRAAYFFIFNRLPYGWQKMLLHFFGLWAFFPAYFGVFDVRKNLCLLAPFRGATNNWWHINCDIRFTHVPWTHAETCAFVHIQGTLRCEWSLNGYYFFLHLNH